MKTTTKALLIALCALLLVVGSVSITVAYLTGEDSVTNTFTVGKVAIVLDEADVKPDGSYETDVNARVDANVYHLIPGHEYIKDPVIHVDEKSEDCWLFIKLENGLKAIIDDVTIEAQLEAEGWTLIDEANCIYAYKDPASAGDDVDTFKTFKIKGEAVLHDKEGNALYSEDTPITVIAYAVQRDAFDTAAAAWSATFGATEETTAQ